MRQPFTHELPNVFYYSEYSWDDVTGDTSLSSFNTDSVPSYVWTVLADINAVQPTIKLYILPWSPPGWMKDSGTMKGGAFKGQYLTVYANYLLKAVQAFSSKGYSIHALSLQVRPSKMPLKFGLYKHSFWLKNEPLNSDGTYPTNNIASSEAAIIGNTLRPLLDNNDFRTVKHFGYEHNWDNSGETSIYRR